MNFDKERERGSSVFTRTPFEEESCSRKPLCEHSNLSIVEIARYRSRSNNSNYKTISIEFSNKLRIRSGKSFSPVSADCTVNQTSETTQLSFNRSVKFAGETARATKIQAPIFFSFSFLFFKSDVVKERFTRGPFTSCHWRTSVLPKSSFSPSCCKVYFSFTDGKLRWTRTKDDRSRAYFSYVRELLIYSRTSTFFAPNIFFDLPKTNRNERYIIRLTL